MKNNYSVSIETITPEKASALLANFPRNRKSAPSRVDSYADTMSRGMWASFSMIIIDEDGNTVNGHHRLEAVVKSGASVDMVVFRGLEHKYVPFIDTGRSRSAGDMLAFVEEMDGLDNLKNIASLVKAIFYYDKRNSGAVIPYDMLASFITDNKDAIKVAYMDYKRLKPIGGVLSHAAALFVIRRSNPNLQDEIDAFVERISKGEGLYSGMPAYAVRNAIISAKRNTRGGGLWMSSFFTILRAWKAEMNNEKLVQIKTKNVTIGSIVDMNIVKENN